MRSSMTKLRSTKKFEIVLDSNKLKWFYMSCAAALPQLDRGSDQNQNVIGSNPIRRTN